MRAMFCVSDNFSAGRMKSAAPAATTPHFITGALNSELLVSTDLLSSRPISEGVSAVDIALGIVDRV